MNKILEILKKDKFNSFVSILAVSISYTFLALIIIFLSYSGTAITFLQKQVELTIFFKDTYTEENILKLQEILNSDTRVMETEYISKIQALELFNVISKDDPALQEAASINTNIFPASLKIKTFNLSDLDALMAEYQTQEYVDSIRYSKEIKDSFSYYAWITSIVLGILFVMFLIVSFGIIISTIRINIYQKKDEIEIMKLVGASDDFIRSPFILQGLVFSMLGAMVASILGLVITLSIYYTNTFGFRDLNKIYFGAYLSTNYLFFVIILVLVINLIGYLLGYFGTKMAVSKYLKI